MSGRIDKTELIKKLRDLEGLTNEEKSNLIGLLRQHKKYGLVWEDKPEDIEERLRDELPVLTEVKERALISDQPNAPNHILIEGDNLEALTALSYTHEGKIDVIYIDPPYNTGNKDFAYYDDFCDEYRTIPYVEREDAFRHSKWLSFMSKRLRIAKRLLSDKGVIFISIDDNEQANLKLLCDEVFGADSFTGNVIWEKTDSPRMDVKGFTVRHDYILVYQKSDFVLQRIMPDDIPEHYNKTDEEGRLYYLKPLRLMDLINVNVTEDSCTYDSESLEEAQSKHASIIQWSPIEGSVKATVVMPDNTKVNGFIEPDSKDVRVDDMVQLERFGFARVDNITKEGITFYYTHN